MMTIEHLLASPWAIRIGTTLLHFLWQGTAIALALAVTLWFLRQRTPHIRWLVSCAALALMLAAPAATVWVVAPEPQVSVESKPVVSAGVPAEDPAMVAALHVPAAEGGRERALPETVPQVSIDMTPIAEAAWSERAYELVQPALPWVAFGWVIGVAGLVLWHLGGWVQSHRLKRRRTRPASQAVREMVGRLARMLRVARPVRVLESALARAPVVIGWLRPVVLLPVSTLAGVTPAQFEAILAHELAHIRRYDCLVCLVQVVAETLLFYHPAVWWVSRRIRTESEYCCDEIAAEVCGDRKVYARAMATVAELASATPPLAVAATGGSVLARIRRVLRLPESDHAVRPGWLAGMLVFVMLAAGAVIVVGCLGQGEKPAPVKAAGGAEDGASETVDAQQRHIRELIYVLRYSTIASRVDEWTAAVKELAGIGPPAVPDLVAELDRTTSDATMREIAFVLRLINDPRAMPSLIRALPRTPIGTNDYGEFQLSDRQVQGFMATHLGVVGPNDGFGWNRAVTQVTKALESLTGHTEGVEALAEPDEAKNVQKVERVQAVRRLVADRWREWWRAHEAEYVTPEQMASLASGATREQVEAAGIARFGPIFPTGAEVRLGPTIEQVIYNQGLGDMKPAYLDLDLGKALARRKGVGTSNAWRTENGIDAFAVRTDSGNYIVYGEDLHCWQVQESRWDSLEKELHGRRVELPVATKGDFGWSGDWTYPVTFLFTTRAGGRGILQILGENETHDGLRLRYRLVAATSGVDPAGGVSAPDPTGGAEDAQDAARYSFPDQSPDGLGRDVEQYQSVCDRMRVLAKPDAALLESDYQEMKGTLEKLAQDSKGPLFPYAERRLILLDWVYSKTNAMDTVDRLNGLAERLDAKQSSLTKGIAVAVLCRDNDFKGGGTAFAAMDPQSTTEYGWFLFEVLKYGGRYASEFTPKESKATVGVSEKDATRRREFAKYFEDALLPGMEKLLAKGSQLSSLERAQLVVAIERSAQEVHWNLAPRDLLDVSRRAVYDLLPKILELWSKSIELLDDKKDTLETASSHRKKLASYREVIMPRLQTLLKQAEFAEEFGPDSRHTRQTIDNLDSIDLVAPQATTDEETDWGRLATSDGKRVVRKLPDDAEQAAWGEAVEGVEVRLLAEKASQEIVRLEAELEAETTTGGKNDTHPAVAALRERIAYEKKVLRDAAGEQSTRALARAQLEYASDQQVKLKDALHVATKERFMSEKHPEVIALRTRIAHFDRVIQEANAVLAATEDAWGEAARSDPQDLVGAVLTAEPRYDANDPIRIRMAWRGLNWRPVNLDDLARKPADRRGWSHWFVRINGKDYRYDGPVNNPWGEATSAPWQVRNCVIDHSEWPPGTYRVQYLAKNLPIVRLNEPQKPLVAAQIASNEVVFEIIPAEERAWGEAVEGVQVRVRAEKMQWKAGETPTMHVECRSSGKGLWWVPKSESLLKILVDGTLYYKEAYSQEQTSDRMEPGKTVALADVELRDWELVEGKHDRLGLQPGKHRVQVACRPWQMGPDATGLGKLQESGQIREVEILSNAVEIEILPTDARPAAPAAPKNVPGDAKVFSVKLPNGVTVELLALWNLDEDGKQQWWRPDGTPLAELERRRLAPHAPVPTRFPGAGFRFAYGYLFNATDATGFTVSTDAVGATQMLMTLTAGAPAQALVAVPAKAGAADLPGTTAIRVFAGRSDDLVQHGRTGYEATFTGVAIRPGVEALVTTSVASIGSPDEGVRANAETSGKAPQAAIRLISADPKTGRYHWRVSRDVPVRIAFGSAGRNPPLEISGFSGGTPETKGVGGDLDFELVVSEADGKLKLKFIRNGKVNTIHELGLFRDPRAVAEDACRQTGDRLTTADFLSLWRRRYGVDGKVVDEVQVVARAMTDEETDWSRPAAANGKRVVRELPDDAEQAAWGEAVEGVEVRLRAEKFQWKGGETPVFKVDLKSAAARPLSSGPVGPDNDFSLEVDGRTYEYKGPDFRSDNERSSVTLREGIPLAFMNGWKNSQDGTPLVLTPGKHKVQVAFIVQPAKAGEQPVRAESNPVEIEILLPGNFIYVPAKPAADGDKVSWGEAGERVAARIEDLVRKLADASGAEREAARRSLRAEGMAALPILDKHLQSDDPEIRSQVDAAVQDIVVAMTEEDQRAGAPRDLSGLSGDLQVRYQVGALLHLRVDTWWDNVLGLRERQPQNPAETLRKLGKAAVPRLLASLADGRPTRTPSPWFENRHLEVRDVALQVLALIADRHFLDGASLLSQADEQTQAKTVASAAQWWRQNSAKSENQWLRESLVERKQQLRTSWTWFDTRVCTRLIELEGEDGVTFLHQLLDDAPELLGGGGSRIREALTSAAENELELRLEPARKQWRAGESIQLTASVRNRGRRGFTVALQPAYANVLLPEGKAVWQPALVAEPIPFGPGKTYENISVTLPTSWERADGGGKVSLGPGKHIFAIGFPAQPTQAGEKPVQFFGVIEIEILPAEAKASEEARELMKRVP